MRSPSIVHEGEVFSCKVVEGRERESKGVREQEINAIREAGCEKWDSRGLTERQGTSEQGSKKSMRHRRAGRGGFENGRKDCAAG